MRNTKAHVMRQGILAGVMLAITVIFGGNVAYAETGTPTPVSTLATPEAVGSTLETHIDKNGAALLRGATITGISGSNISAVQTYGSFQMSWTIHVSSSTELLRRYGAASSLSEFTIGDHISASGIIDRSQTSGTIDARVVKNFSIQKKNASLSGTVQSVTSSTTSFVLAQQSGPAVTVFVLPSTQMKQGGVIVPFSTLAAGQKISRVYGVLNTLNNTLQAVTVDIYQQTGLLNKRVFEGKVTSLVSSTTPTTFGYLVGTNAYTVNVAANTQLLSASWNPIQMGLIRVGDKVRVYGALQPANFSFLDAYVIRDTNIK